MTAMPPAPPAQQVGPRPFRFTREQYYEMGRRGYFDGARVELIFGEVVEMSPIGWLHRLATERTADVLGPVFSAGFFVSVQQPFAVPGGKRASDPQPDVSVTPGALGDYTDHPTVAALLVEVADESLAYDLTTKAELYATAGVADYWVVDIPNRLLHVFRDPHPLPLPDDIKTTAYRTHLTLQPAESVSPLAAPHASVRVADLLP